MSNLNITWMENLIAKGNVDGGGYLYTADMYPDQNIKKFVTLSPIDTNIVDTTSSFYYDEVSYKIAIRYRVKDFTETVSARKEMLSYFNNYFSKLLIDCEVIDTTFVNEFYFGTCLGIDINIQTLIR